jgi:COP9 signalosome complex subunit 2
MYEITLEALKSANNDRLWFNTNLKLANLYLSTGKVADVERILEILKRSCQLPDGSDDVSKATHLLEVYCLEIQLCTATENALRMRLIYPKTLNLNAAVSDPRIMGVIREEGGKMYMIEGQWMEAFNELFEAFRAFQQVGNIRAKTCLKYLALASMLAASDINPFSAAETKAFKDDAEIIAMLELRRALDTGDLRRFERTVRDKRNGISSEPFLMTHIGPLRLKMQEQVTPYRYC